MEGLNLPPLLVQLLISSEMILSGGVAVPHEDRYVGHRFPIHHR